MSATEGFDLGHALEVLERTPAVLEALLGGLSDAWLHATEGGDSWSPVMILAHLVHGEITDWVPRTRIILEHGEARPFDPFDRAGGPTDRGPGEILDEFRRLRERNVATVRAMALSAEDLQRTGLHPTLGRVTLRELLATWAVHDLGHIRQVARVMAKRYRTEVGPWEAFLPVVHE